MTTKFTFNQNTNSITRIQINENGIITNVDNFPADDKNMTFFKVDKQIQTQAMKVSTAICDLCGQKEIAPADKLRGWGWEINDHAFCPAHKDEV